MSYILDALRKSEEARRRRQGAELGLGDAPLGEVRGSRSQALPLLAGALLVNAIVFGAWMLRSTPEEVAITTNERLPHERLPARLPEPAPETPASERARTSPAAPWVPAGPDYASFPVLTLSSLSAPERRRFERLTISTHVYADEPSFREVGISGRIYREGERIDGMTLVAITATGIHLGVDESVIAIDLQDQWAF